MHNIMFSPPHDLLDIIQLYIGTSNFCHATVDVVVLSEKGHYFAIMQRIYIWYIRNSNKVNIKGCCIFIY
jgi:hypothetical protein